MRRDPTNRWTRAAERVSQLVCCGGGCFDSRRRVNSTVRQPRGLMYETILDINLCRHFYNAYSGNRDGVCLQSPRCKFRFCFALYGPSMLIQRLGLGPDCVNANSISEKLGCMRFGFVVDLIVYPLVICGSSLMVYFILFRRERRIRLSQVN